MRGGAVTRYGHLKYKSVAVSVGQHVKKGDILGYIGDTGYTFGAHVHFDITIGGQRVDPLPYVIGDKAVVPVPKPTPAPAPTPQPSKAFKEGDKVILNGCLYGDSWGGSQGQKRTGSTHTITRVVDLTRPAPYLIDGGLGWVKGSDIKLVGAVAPEPVPKPEPKPVPAPQPVGIKVGDKVVVKAGAKSVSGDKLVGWLSDKKEARTVMSISGGNATIGKDGAITATTAVGNLIKV